MEVFDVMESFLVSLPAWCLFLPPAVLLVAAVPLFLFRKGRLYRWVAALLFVCGVLLSLGFMYRELYLALLAGIALILYPLFFLRKVKRDKNARAEQLYEKFKPEMEQPLGDRTEYPPKVCCYEDKAGETPEERGMKLSHVISLLEKLKKEKLTPADRLEVEMLSRNVAGAEHRSLSGAQADDLSDSLSAVLRLMAKYS